MKIARTAAMAAAAALALAATADGTAQPTSRLPMPVLYLTTVEPFTTRAGAFMRYRYDVLNKADYPAEMFAPAPSLPPCGNNANSARTWVDLFEGGGRRLYGFCALGGPEDLGSLWFALPEGQIPPSYVYIELIDRQADRRYRSNLADTVM